jgi:O-acetyl-ADP-ribose deacetylase (regulator of RNase III)
MSIKIGNTEFEVIQGDITLLDIEAIVNPANTFLIHGGGLAAAIVKRGGMIIQQESKKIGNVSTGNAVITTGGNLKAKHVIHAVGPKYKDGKSGEEEKLKSAVINSLIIAEQKKLTSIAFPAISSGTYGYPIELASKIIISSVIEYFKNKTKDKQETTLKKVVFCLKEDYSYNAFKNELSVLNKKSN